MRIHFLVSKSCYVKLGVGFLFCSKAKFLSKLGPFIFTLRKCRHSIRTLEEKLPACFITLFLISFVYFINICFYEYHRGTCSFSARTIVLVHLKSDSRMGS